MATALADINEQQLEQDNALVISQGQQLAITSPETYTQATELGKEINTRIKTIKEYFKPMKQAADEAKNRILEKERAALQPLTQLLNRIDELMVAWKTEQDRLQAEAQRKLNEQATLTAAELAEAQGDEEAVDAILNGNGGVAPVIAPQTTPRVSGSHFVSRYSAQVFDPMALIKHVAKNPQLVGLLSPNQVALNGMAKSLKQAMSLPGVRVVVAQDVVRRHV